MRSEGDPDTGDQGVTEAYDGLGATWQLWQEAYGRNSLDGKGLPLVATVHFGTNYDNAFWDGTQMVFGDGDGVVFLPFTRSVDVIGHELAHGVTQYTSGLNYQDQSGALNESVSDVFGVLVKQRLLGQTADQADWLVGAELLAPGVNGVAHAVDGRAGHRLRRPAAGQGPAAGPPARLRRHHRRQRRRPHQLRHPQQGLPRASPRPSAATPGRSPARSGSTPITGDISADCDFATFARLTVAAATARHGAGSEVVAAVRAGWDAVGVAWVAAAPSAPGTPPSRRRHGSGAGSGSGDGSDSAHAPGPTTEVSVRRTGGFAGRTVERTVALGELPNGDARAWQLAARRRRAARRGRRGRRAPTDARRLLLRRALRGAAARPRAARAPSCTDDVRGLLRAHPAATSDG